MKNYLDYIFGSGIIIMTIVFIIVMEKDIRDELKKLSQKKDAHAIGPWNRRENNS